MGVSAFIRTAGHWYNAIRKGRHKPLPVFRLCASIVGSGREVRSKRQNEALQTILAGDEKP